jgi:Glycosyl hydrolase 36 superfamily, catalytic domain
MQMTESNLVSAQAAYVYPRLAELADARGDTAFAAKLRATAEDLRDVLRREWTGDGWEARGYAGVKQLGEGVIYGEPQPWALLSGALDAKQAGTLVANIRRFLTGVGAPGGPERVGSSQSPAADDPGVRETSVGGDNGVGDGHAVYVGGSWFAINGWLTWALGELDGVVPKAREYAFDELVRNTLAVRATVYPDHWNGILSVDDACRSWYSKDPANCGVGLSSAYDTQIMHQPAWSLFDAIRLAGVTPTADGYRIAPHLPMDTFSLRLPRVGVSAARGRLSGFVRPEASGVLRMRVRADGRRAFANGRRVAAKAEDGFVVFDLPARADQAAEWSVR